MIFLTHKKIIVMSTGSACLLPLSCTTKFLRKSLLMQAFCAIKLPCSVWQ